MPPPYKPAGCCIYCGSDKYSEYDQNRKLGEEHIIPASLGGNLILLEASCKQCEKITSGIETACMPLYNPGRYHLGIRSRKRKRTRTKLPLTIGRSNEKILIETDRHPGVLWGFRYTLPELLVGLPLPTGNEFSGDILMAPAIPNFKERLGRLGTSTNVIIGAGVSQITFGRFLAKIAHAFTSAEIGLGEFHPFLLNIIFNNNTSSLSQLIGSPMGDDDPVRDSSLHEISFANISESYITVRIRLFAEKHLPTYYVVSGKPQ